MLNIVLSSHEGACWVVFSTLILHVLLALLQEYGICYYLGCLILGRNHPNTGMRMVCYCNVVHSSLESIPTGNGNIFQDRQAPNLTAYIEESEFIARAKV